MVLKILPVFDYKKRFSKERESVYTWNVPAEHVYYLDKTLERTSSFEPDQRLVVSLLSYCHMLIGR